MHKSLICVQRCLEEETSISGSSLAYHKFPVESLPRRGNQAHPWSLLPANCGSPPIPRIQNLARDLRPQLYKFSLILQSKSEPESGSKFTTRARLGSVKAFSCACDHLAATSTPCARHSTQPPQLVKTTNTLQHSTTWLSAKCASRRRENNGDEITPLGSTQSRNAIHKQACWI